MNYNTMNKTIKLTETDLHNIIKESVKHILNEEYNSNLKKKYINKLYRITKDLTSHLYRDDDWRAVSNAFNIIRQAIGNEGELSVRVEDGGYWKPLGEYPNYKEYLFTILLYNDIEINGSLKCHAAGTMNDVFEKYDITITFW